MSKVLVVEDDDDKASDLVAFLSSRYRIDELRVARSLKSGLLDALSSSWDLILLDMTMRNFDRSLEDDGGRPHHFAGREILRQMRREGVHSVAIVVTTFDRFGEELEEVTLSELVKELEAQFPDYVGTVHYRSNVDEWKAQLSTMIGESLVGK